MVLDRSAIFICENGINGITSSAFIFLSQKNKKKLLTTIKHVLYW